MKKHHLYYSGDLSKVKDGIEVWKGYRRKIPKIPKEKNEKTKEKEKNYEPQKARFQHLQKKASYDYENRYSEKLLEHREELGITPELYIKISFFDNIDEESILFTNYHFELVSKDELLKEYIVKLSLTGFEKFMSLINNFVKSD